MSPGYKRRWFINNSNNVGFYQYYKLEYNDKLAGTILADEKEIPQQSLLKVVLKINNIEDSASDLLISAMFPWQH